MTMLLPRPNILDRLLRALGKKRGVFLPAEDSENFGPYAYSTGQKESFVRALLRSGRTPLPDGLIDIFEVAGNFSRPAEPDSS